MTWHHMTDEPEGGDGVMVLAMQDEDADEVDEDVVLVSVDGWSVVGKYGINANWGYWRERFPNATWCYLPRRKNDV